MQQLSKARERRITSTRAPAIVGCDPNYGEHWAARDILGLNEDHETTPAMERGQFLEAGIAQWFVHRMRTQAQRELEVIKPPFTIHREHRWLGDSIDGLLYESGDVVGGLEAKNYISDRRFEFGEPWTDQVDERTLIQCVVHMAVHEVPRVYVPLVDWDMSIYVVHRDAELEASVIYKCQAFWDRWIKPALERLQNGAKPTQIDLPPVDGHDDTCDWIKQQWRESRGHIIEAEGKHRETADALLAARVAHREATAEKKRLENVIKLAIGDAAGITFGEDGSITWRPNKNGTRALRFSYRGDGND
jgi:hypothetical protein